MRALLLALLLSACCPGLFCAKCARNAAAKGCEGKKESARSIPYCGEMPGDTWCTKYACAEYAHQHRWARWLGFDTWAEGGCYCSKQIVGAMANGGILADGDGAYYWPFPVRYSSTDDAPPIDARCEP